MHIDFSTTFDIDDVVYYHKIADNPNRLQTIKDNTYIERDDGRIDVYIKCYIERIYFDMKADVSNIKTCLEYEINSYAYKHNSSICATYMATEDELVSEKEFNEKLSNGQIFIP